MRPLTVYAYGPSTNLTCLLRRTRAPFNNPAEIIVDYIFACFGEDRVEFIGGGRTREALSTLVRRGQLPGRVLVWERWEAGISIFDPSLGDDLYQWYRQGRGLIITVDEEPVIPEQLRQYVNLHQVWWPDAVELWHMIEELAPRVARQLKGMERLEEELYSLFYNLPQATLERILPRVGTLEGLKRMLGGGGLEKFRLPPQPVRFLIPWFDQEDSALGKAGVSTDLLRFLGSAEEVPPIACLLGEEKAVSRVLDALTWSADSFSRGAIPGGGKALLLEIDLGVVAPYSWASLLGKVGGRHGVVVAVRGVNDHQSALGVAEYLARVRPCSAIFFVGESERDFGNWHFQRFKV